MVKTQKPDGSFLEKKQTRTFSQIQSENAVIKEEFPEIEQVFSPCGIPLSEAILTETISEEDIKI